VSDEDDASGALDVATLSIVARRTESHPLVEGWTFEPDSMSPRRLEVHLDASQYPRSVTDVRLDVRWFEGGDSTFHYLESHKRDDWQCRWDCHPKPEAPRAHFHPPPDAAARVEESGVDESHHLGVCFAVLEWIESRLEALHEDD
jgi:hypothetical protein